MKQKSLSVNEKIHVGDKKERDLDDAMDTPHEHIRNSICLEMPSS